MFSILECYWGPLVPDGYAIDVKKTYQFTTAFKDDSSKLAELKQQISQKMTTSSND